MSLSKKQWVLVVLFGINVVTFGYGFWFKGLAWDEEQFYAGGRILGKFFYSMFQGEPVLEKNIVSIYGLTGKYLAFVAMVLYEPFAMLGGYSLHDVMVLVRFVTSFLPTLLTVVLLYRQVSMHLGTEASYVILVLSAFAFRWVEQSHYAVPDSLVTLFVIGVLGSLLKSTYRIRELLHLSLLLALALHTKINVGVVLLAFSGWILLVQWFRRKVVLTIKTWLLLAFLYVGWVVLLGLPYLLHLETFWQVLRYHIKDFPFLVKGSPLVYFYFRPALGVDWGILAVAAIGIIHLLRKFNTYVFLNLAWSVFFYMFLATSKGAIPRWEVPLIPSLLVVGTYGLIGLAERMQRYKTWVVSMSLLLVIARPAYHVCMLDLGLGYNHNLSLKHLYEAYGCKKVYYNFSLDYPTVKSFIRSSCNCAVLYEPYWNDLETNGIPRRFEVPASNASYIGLPRDSIRMYIRQHWKIAYSHIPLFFTSWTFNPAVPKKVSFYVRPE